MDEGFTIRESTGPAFATDADRAAELQSKAGTVYEIKEHIAFAGNEMRAAVLGETAQTPETELQSAAMPDIDGENGEIADVSFNSESGMGGENSATTPPRPSRATAYYDVLHQKDKSSTQRRASHKITGMTEQGISAATQIAGMGDDFDTYSVNDAGIQATVAGAKMEASAISAGAGAAWNVGRGTVRAAADLKDGTMTAKEAATFGRRVLTLEGKKSAKKIGSAGVRTAMQYMTSFQAMSDDFAGAVPGKVKDTAFSVGYAVARIRNFLMHPVKTIVAGLKTAGILAGVLLGILVLSLLFNMISTTITSVLCAEQSADVPLLVQNINEYRNEAITEELYTAFQNDVDPNGNPYGYATLGGRRSNNLQHGVTWNYANGISNNTAEIISLAAVYYQQQWPSAGALAAFDDGVPFTRFCRALAAYGLNVTARESSPYSCMSYGGCVNSYRSEGETVTIQDYRQSTHTCREGDSECGSYGYNGVWHWNSGHSDGGSYTEWVKDGTYDVTVLFPVIFPETAGNSELCALPDGAQQMESGSISAGDCTGALVLPSEANLYKGVSDDWFYTPGTFTYTFTVVTGEGEDAVSDDYTVTFSNATAIPWCPGELHDGQYGHYDLNCTIFLTGYDAYAEPETDAPDGTAGGTGTLEAMAASLDTGSLTRTILKQDQHGNEYAGNAVTARFTKTVNLPAGDAGFQGWYENGEDAFGNVAWAVTLYRMDWADLYGVTDGIKCRTIGSSLTAEELQALLDGLNIDPETARGQVVAFALACQGHFSYGQPTSLSGGPGTPIVGSNLDCSSFIQYCFWAQGLPFSAGQTASYLNAGDLRSIPAAEAQPGDLRVVYANGNEQGHVQMYLGSGAWIECCYGYGVCVNMSNAWMESHACHYFAYAGF